MNTQKIILEPSSNPHELEAQNIEVEDLKDGIIKLKIIGDGLVTHGEHGTIKTESIHVLKYIQQELDPLDQNFRNAFD